MQIFKGGATQVLVLAGQRAERENDRVTVEHQTQQCKHVLELAVFSLREQQVDFVLSVRGGLFE